MAPDWQCTNSCAPLPTWAVCSTSRPLSRAGRGAGCAAESGISGTRIQPERPVRRHDAHALVSLISDGVLRPEPFFDNASYASFDDGIEITGIAVNRANRHEWQPHKMVLSLERLSLVAVAAPVHETPLFSDERDPEPPQIIPVTVPASFTIAYRFK